jgi:hypothetical protein
MQLFSAHTMHTSLSAASFAAPLIFSNRRERIIFAESIPWGHLFIQGASWQSKQLSDSFFAEKSFNALTCK